MLSSALLALLGAHGIHPPRYWAPAALNISNPLLWPDPTDMPASAAGVSAADRAVQARIHYAFSTGCEVQHDWQSLGVFFSARRVSPYSNVTRLVSCHHRSNALEDGHVWPPPNGMKFNDESLVGTEVRGSDRDGKLGLGAAAKAGLYSLPEERAVGQFHLSPLYTTHRITGDNYAPYCKSASLSHWFRKAPPSEPIVVNLDPDVILLRPLGDIEPESLRGRPIGQYHRMGDEGKSTGCCAAVLAKVVSDGAWCAAEPVACARLAAVDVKGSAWRAAGQVGTPYIAHRDDWIELAPRWQFYTEVGWAAC